MLTQYRSTLAVLLRKDRFLMGKRRVTRSRIFEQRRKTRTIPLEQLDQVILNPGLYILSVYHEDGCPTIASQRADECTCTNPDVEFMPFESIGVAP